MDEIKKIYNEAFGCYPGFDDAFFSAFAGTARVLCVNGKTVSVLFLLPCAANGKKLYYLYAAATAKSERGKGYMKKLLERVKAEADAPLFLMPADESLISFYEKCGFYKARGVNKNGDVTVTVSKDHERLSALCGEGPDNFTLMFSVPAGDLTYTFPYTMQ